LNIQKYDESFVGLIPCGLPPRIGYLETDMESALNAIRNTCPFKV
jgi:hypothetical protein